LNWFEELLEYGKDTFNLLRKRKIIFLPYVALILLKMAIFLVLFGFGVYIARDFIDGGMNPDFIFDYSFLPMGILGGLLVGLIALVIKSYIDAGISSLFLLALKGEEISLSDFWAGGNYFFSRIFGGNLLIILTGLILSPFLLVIYVIVGIITLGLGFFALPLLIGVFLGMWQVSLVTNDSDIMTSIKNSIRFGKDYFWPFLFVNFIEGIISGVTSFSGGGSNNSSGIKYDLELNELERIPSFFWQEGINWLIGLGSVVFGFFFIITSLISMIFDVFFKGYYFVLYFNKRAHL